MPGGPLLQKSLPSPNPCWALFRIIDTMDKYVSAIQVHSSTAPSRPRLGTDFTDVFPDRAGYSGRLQGRSRKRDAVAGDAPGGSISIVLAIDPYVCSHQRRAGLMPTIIETISVLKTHPLLPHALYLVHSVSIGNSSCQRFKHALGRAFWCRDPLMGNSRNLLMPTRPHELMNLSSLLRRLEGHTGFGFEIRIPTRILVAKKHGIGVALVCRQTYGHASPSICEE
ncbi:hypothetical protein BDP55DRAFT_638800 [Colletotrichum godetiae]|uniref:Uncharacterized protein n=1 Tax=Colletotrichum godetiae TaxID=1209918 RepID=A0AAJ0AA82_9PEZI|nr:uncharacterized protein BDP55DRAFT_638800 [Colletotrichum godetiae]KAK1657340.1 hypothetical protein BDP55DRAFT_638800 [Colletotrichum godetiae]